jgi:Subtilase family
MDKTPMFMHNTFWQEDQISVTFAVSSQPGSTFPDTETILSGLDQQFSDLNAQISDLGFTLSFFSEENTRGPVPSHPSQMGSSSSKPIKDDTDALPPGVYLFPPPPGAKAPPGALISVPMVGFFHLDTTKPGVAQPGTGNVQEDCKDDPTLSPVVRIVNRINCLLQAGKFPPGQVVSISVASPNWFSGATQTQGPIIQGCPLLPPIPIPADASCSSSHGLFPITLPELSKNVAGLKSMTGEGVTVFILDTLPRSEQITRAAQAAEGNNLLLLDIADNDNVNLDYSFLPDVLDIPSPSQPATGKDILGRVVGFRMPDHGLFAAGIVRDLAPNASIECIRVLNDWCVGDCETLSRALQSIHNRMQVGDLRDKPVVINLSLVIPSDDEIEKRGLNITEHIRDNLFQPMHDLDALGAIFVASAGNEGDLRYNPMNMPQTRPEALYPAAFAYKGLDRMIPVGAVDRHGKATQYSCYPGTRGVATYGGDVPKDADIEILDGMTRVKKVDALVGIYSSLSYPALSIDDRQSTYAVPNAHGWAYWVGTSFATPIVSAVAACALELQLRSPDPVSVNPIQIVVSSAATHKTEWTHLSPTGDRTAIGPVIRAVQCRPTEEDNDEEEVDIEVTSVVQKEEEVDVEVIDVVVKE